MTTSGRYVSGHGGAAATVAVAGRDRSSVAAAASTSPNLRPHVPLCNACFKPVIQQRDGQFIATRCNHAFCGSCGELHLKSGICPQCQRSIETVDMRWVSLEEEIAFEMVGLPPTKVAAELMTNVCAFAEEQQAIERGYYRSQRDRALQDLDRERDEWQRQREEHERELGRVQLYEREIAAEKKTRLIVEAQVEKLTRLYTARCESDGKQDNLDDEFHTIRRALMPPSQDRPREDSGRTHEVIVEESPAPSIDITPRPSHGTHGTSSGRPTYQPQYRPSTRVSPHQSGAPVSPHRHRLSNLDGPSPVNAPASGGRGSNRPSPYASRGLSGSGGPIRINQVYSGGGGGVRHQPYSNEPVMSSQERRRQPQPSHHVQQRQTVSSSTMRPSYAQQYRPYPTATGPGVHPSVQSMTNRAFVTTPSNLSVDDPVQTPVPSVHYPSSRPNASFMNSGVGRTSGSAHGSKPVGPSAFRGPTTAAAAAASANYPKQHAPPSSRPLQSVFQTNSRQMPASRSQYR